MKLLLFELKKFIKNTKNIVVIGLTFFIIVAVCLIDKQQLIEEKEKIFLEDSYIHKQLISDLEEIQQQEGLSSPLMDNYFKAIQALENKVKYSNSEEWRRSLTEDNLFIDTVRRIQKMDLLGHISAERLAGRAENDFYLKHDIKPDNCLYGVSAMYYVRVILSVVFSMYGYLFFILLFYDIFSREKENNHFNWLVTLPVPYKKITKSKTLLSLMIIVVVSALGLLFTFIVGAILSQRVGAINYPMAFKVANEQVLESLSFSRYFFIAFVAFLLMMLLMIQLLSLSFKTKLNSEKVLLLSLVSLVAISQFTKLISGDLRYFTVIHYIDLSTTIVELYKDNLVCYYVLSIVSLLFVTSVIFVNSIRKK